MFLAANFDNFHLWAMNRTNKKPSLLFNFPQFRIRWSVHMKLSSSDTESPDKLSRAGWHQLESSPRARAGLGAGISSCARNLMSYPLTTQQLSFIFRKGRKGEKKPWVLEHLTSKMPDFPHRSQKKILCKYKSFWHFSFVLSQHCQSNPWANTLVAVLSLCKTRANFTRNPIKPKNKARGFGFHATILKSNHTLPYPLTSLLLRFNWKIELYRGGVFFKYFSWMEFYLMLLSFDDIPQWLAWKKSI